MLSRVLFLTVTAVIALATSGCWDYMDIENRAFVFGVAVDPNPAGNGYLVTTEIAHPQGQPQPGSAGGQLPEPPKLLKSRQGTTLGEALYHLGDGHLSRVPLWQEVNAILVSDEVAREGIGPILDLFFRSSILNLRPYLYIVEGSAADVLAWIPEFQPLTSRYLRDIERQFDQNPLYAKPRSMISIASMLREEDAILLPRIVMEGNEVRLKGSAVIQDGALVGWLDEETSVGANWLIGDLDRTMAQVACPMMPNEHITMELNAMGKRVRIAMERDGVHVLYEIDANIRLLDMARCQLDPFKPENIRSVEQEAEAWMRQRAELAITRAQKELRADFLGLGLNFSRSYPVAWRQIEWNKLFPEVTIQVKARANFAEPGVLQGGATPVR